MKFLIVVLLTFTTSSSFANSVTIDFQSLEHIGEGYTEHGNSYREDGYTLTAPDFNWDDSTVFISSFSSFNTLSTHYTGNTALTANGGAFGFGAQIRLTKDGGGAFNLNSIELAPIFSFDDINVTFTGTRADASTITQTFAGSSFLSTYSFIDFNDVVQVDWTNPQFRSSHQFDNIVISSGNVSTVPLPAAAWLFGSGIMGFLGLRRKAST